MNPTTFSRILIAIDGSDLAEKAGFTAVDLAQRYSGEVIILHVAKYPPNTLGMNAQHAVSVGLPLADPLTERLKKQAIASMDRVAAYASKSKVPSKKLVVDTSSAIAATIADHAYRDEADLIVVGDTGTNEYRATLTGSVAEGIMHEARCAVMIVR